MQCWLLLHKLKSAIADHVTYSQWNSSKLIVMWLYFNFIIVKNMLHHVLNKSFEHTSYTQNL